LRRALFLASAAIAASAQAAGPADSDWPSYGNDQGATRYSTLKQITPENVDKLQVAWTYHMRPAGYVPPPLPPGLPPGFRLTGFSSSQATPIVIKGVMYFPSPYGKVVALDADTGKEIWTYQMPARDQASTRGVQYWPGTRGAKPEIVFGTRSARQAIGRSVDPCAIAAPKRPRRPNRSIAATRPPAARALPTREPPPWWPTTVCSMPCSSSSSIV